MNVSVRFGQPLLAVLVFAFAVVVAKGSEPRNICVDQLMYSRGATPAFVNMEPPQLLCDQLCGVASVAAPSYLEQLIEQLGQLERGQFPHLLDRRGCG
jgi:hypothetical protein